MRTSARCLLTLLLLLPWVPRDAGALTISPIRLDLAPSGRGATGTFLIRNKAAVRVAVELSMARRISDVDGKETNPPVEEGFLLYPQQVVLDPGEARRVRVSWVGDRNPRQELPFRLICEQLPVDLVATSTEGVGAHVRLMMRYLASVYVVPKGARHAVVVDEAHSEVGPDGAPRLVLVLDNLGNRHALMRNPVVRVSSGPIGKEAGGAAVLALEGPDLRGLLGENLLAGQRRKFVLPWPAALAPGKVHAEIDVEKKR